MADNGGPTCCGPGYASPAEAMKAPRETLLYTVALYIGTGIPETGLSGHDRRRPREPDLFAGHQPARDAGHW